MTTMHHNLLLHVLQAFTATGAIFASEAAVFSEGWTASIEKIGLAVVLVVFFVITGWKREQRMAKRIDWLEKENDKLSIRVATLTEQVNQAVLKTATLLADSMRTLEGRMCWACQTRDDFETMQQIIAERRTSK
jgi:hypothetical protein